MIDINKLTIEQLNQTVLWTINKDCKIFSGTVQGYSIENEIVLVKLGGVWTVLTSCYSSYKEAYECLESQCSDLLNQNPLP